MEYPNPKIKFYKVRTLSQKLSITFDFLRENWKPLLKFSFYLIVPVCLLQSFTLNTSMRDFFLLGFNMGAGNSIGGVYSIMMNYALYVLFIMLGTCVVNAMVFSLMTEYERRDKRLVDITLNDFTSLMIKYALKLLFIYLFWFGAVILICAFVFGLVMVLSSMYIPLLIIFALLFAGAAFFLMVPLSLFTPVYLFEEIPFFEALKKAFRYGLSFWGETFVIVLVFSFLANIISGVTMMPWYFVFIFGEIFAMSDPGAGINSSIWYQFITYLLGIIQSYGMYASYILTSIGIAFQYFHIREKKEGISVDVNIQNFDRL